MDSIKNQIAQLLSRKNAVMAVLLLLLISAAYRANAQANYTFTAAGASGVTGPTQTQVNTEYANTSLSGQITITGSGIQRWVVPQSGLYTIRAIGASGGNVPTYSMTGGLGARMEGEFSLLTGDVIQIIVGQKGTDGCGGAGGGGGTYVVRNGTLLIAAGGGGGATSQNNGANGTTATAGTNDFPGGTTPGGTNGGGGSVCNGAGANHGGGGGGYSGNGATSTQNNGGEGGYSFLNGGAGGTNTASGGFGGGGATTSCTVGGGGGGGYSGGAGGQQVNYCTPGINRSGGGGGGSYNTGTNQSNAAGVQTGDGLVYMEILSSGAYNDAGIIGIDSPNVYCAGTHNVVATILNYGVSRIDSVMVNWSINGTNQTPVKYIGLLDTMGGQGSSSAKVTLGSYTFNSASFNISAWTSQPNNSSDTTTNNDSSHAVKKANLPPPTGLTSSTLNATNTTIHWTAGSVSNTWAYVNSTSNVTPIGPGTVVSTDSVHLTGLSPTTTYYFFVREICHSGDSSTWAGPFEYRTPCANILSGNYTINPGQPASSTNFTSISDAAFALQECGISSPIVIYIASGTYNERVLLGEIPGSSSTNTVSFIGAGRTSTIITHAGSSTADWSTVLLDGTDYVRFRNMTIRGTDTDFGIGIHLINKADNNSFDNIRIQMNTGSTLGTTAGVAISTATSTTGTGDAGNNNTFDSLTVTGAYYGISVNGTSTTGAHSTGNKILNSSFTNQYYYGIRFYYQNNLVIENNIVKSFRNTAAYGLYVYYCSDYQVTKNNVVSPYEALRLYYCDRYLMSGNKNSLVANNLFLSEGGYYTMYCYYSYDVQLYHNTFVNRAYSGNAYFSNCNNMDVRNNIFVNSSTSGTGYAVYITGGSQDNLNYNVYYSTGSSFVYHTAARASLAAWKTAFPALNVNSTVANVQFKTTDDIHLKTGGPNYPGTNLGITKDIDGDPRSPSSPTCGADEKIRVPNNAGVTGFTAPVNFCIGAHDVKVEIENAGINKIDSVRVYWSVNGVNQAPVYINTPLDTIGGSGSATLEVTLGNLNFTGSGKTLKVWTSHPNGLTDTINGNDTINQLLKSSLSGTYTLGGTNPDYSSFEELTDDLNALGVCGPITVNISAGTYNERITLGAISGTSSTNTISFIGAGIGSTIITNVGSSTANWSTVLLDGSDHVHFRDMTIRGTGLTYGIGVHLINKADSNSFRNIHVQMNNASTGGNTAGVAITTATSTTGASDAGNYNTFDSLNVTGAYYGFVAYGLGTTTAHSFGNKLLNSTFTNQYNTSVRFYYQNELIIDNNEIIGLRYASAYGMYIYYCSDYMVGNNYVVSPYYGTYLAYGDRALSSGNKNSTVYNNIIQGGTYYSFYSTNTDDLQFYHNTITGDGRYANNAYFTACNNLDIRNNIFINPNTGATSHAIYISGGVDELDYNVYYSLGSTLLYHGATYTDFGVYQTAFPLFDQHSLNIDPQLSSDMHLTGSSPNMPGELLGIPVDIDGDPRCDLQTAIGADEPIYSMINPLAEFAMPDTLFINSPAWFINTSTAIFSEPLGYAWYMDGVEISTDEDIIYTFNATGTYDLMLKTRNCGGYDSFSVSVQVVTPQSVPESDFTASQLVANALPTPDIIQLFDMSLHGATAWTWAITPSQGVIFDPNAANPTVQFTDPGYYDVCLTAENMNGVGTTLCKTAYIYVNDEHWMGGPANSSSMPGGRLSDDGWLANYGANASASFLIKPDPCAGEINLKFSFFDLVDNGDVLSVYDGEDQNGLLIGNYTVGDFPGGNAGLTAYSGKMFLKWTTNGSGEAKGWEANWSTVTDTGTTLPVADFSTSNTIYTGTEATFTATADKVSYRWDFAPPTLTPGMNGGKGKEDSYTWNAQGVYDVKLEVKNCAGTDSITKQITVVDPTSTPVVGFYADQLRVPAHTTVNFFDTSDQGPTGWRWSVTPSGTASFETAKTVKNPSITFYAPGNYEIKLVAENSLGKDSLTKTAYIQVFDYCVPAVGTLNADVGISRVQFAGIDNSSSIGQAGHTKYIKNFAAQKLYQRAQYSITIERNTANDSMSRKAWIDFNGDGDFSDAGERIAFETAAKTLSYTASFTIPVGSFTGLSVLRVGTSYAQGNNSSCGINPMGEFEDYPIEIAIDDILPVITRIGADTVYTEQWYQYADAGATALDELDGDITSQIMVTGTVDSSIVGTYILSYNVSDLATNMAETVIRTVIVTPDVTAPVITLVGTNPLIHTIGTPYNDAGATALDYFNRDITANLLNGNNVDVNTFGTYYFWYTVTDANGNTDSVAREVTVADNIAPVLSFQDDTAAMEVFSDILDPGYIVSDNYYLGADVTIDSSAVIKSVVGIYPMIYTATDSSGNQSSAVLYMKVQDTQLPIITMLNDEIDIEVHTSFVDPGVVRADNYCVTQAVQSVSTIDTAVLGSYTVTYTVTDCEGNISLPVSRTVNVVDRTAPVVTLIGNDEVDVLRWTEYTDEGITVVDNYYSLSQLTIDTIGTWVNSSWESLYYLQYRVTDPSGNVGFSKKRFIDVRGTNSVAMIDGEGVRVYPNPSTGNVSLEFTSSTKSDLTYTITDMAGRTVLNGELAAGLSQYKFDLSDLSAGVYNLILNSETPQTLKLNLIK